VRARAASLPGGAARDGLFSITTVQRHRHGPAIDAALGLALVLVTAGLSSASGQPQVSVDMRGHRLTLRASSMPLADVLARLAAATGLTVELRGRLEQPVTIELVEVTVEKALSLSART
jgi:hypothetical protein